MPQWASSQENSVGMVDVTCQSCSNRFPWDKYAIWVAMYNDDRTRAEEGA